MITQSYMSPDTKRYHLTAIIKRTSHDYQRKFKHKSKIFKDVITFLKEPEEEADSNDILPGEAMNPVMPSIRQLIDGATLNNESDKVHRSVKLDVNEAYDMAGGEDLTQCLTDLIDDNKILTSNTRRCFGKASSHFIEYSYIDFQALLVQEKLRLILRATDPVEFKEAVDYKFNQLELQKTTEGLRKMAKWARVEVIEIMTLRDLIDYQFLNFTKRYYLQ